MLIFIFQSAKDSEVFGCTKDPFGDNLPSELGPWSAYGDSAPQTEGAFDGVGGTDAVRTGIREKGYHLTRASIVVTRQA